MRRSEQLRTLSARAALVLIAVLCIFLAPRPARAGEKDEEAVVGVAEALSEHLSGKSDPAIESLKKLLITCQGAACEKSTRAQIHIALGIVYAGKKDAEQSRLAFENALYEDSTAAPDKGFSSPLVTSAFKAAKENFKKSGGQPPPSRPPPSKEQTDAVNSAQSQLGARDWSGCMQTAIASMADREFAAGKLILARCEDAGDLVIEATNDAKLAVKYADEERNAEVQKQAQALVAKLENDVSTLLIVMPKAVMDLEIKVDGVVVSKEDAEKGIIRNPGKAVVELKGKKGQFPFTFKSTETMDRGEKITVNTETGDKGNNAAIQQCLLAATTPEDLKRCIDSGGKQRGLTILGGLEFSTYNDTNSVNVVSPVLYLSAENPTSGWQLGGSVLVDVVSAASADIVANASRRYDETRVAGTLAGSYKIGPAKIGLNGGFSHEGDYTGRGVGISGSADLLEKRVTPSLAYSFGFDTIGRTGTAWDKFSRDVMRHSIDGSVSVVLNGTTIAAGGGTVEIDTGDTSKPYRHVPIFDPSVASTLPLGATVDLVSKARLPLAPAEQLPTSRLRFAVFGRIAHRFDNSTLRVDERLYIDDWGLKATTTDIRFLYDLSEAFRVGPHVRFHFQGPVDFWQRAYTSVTDASGKTTAPAIRTGDKELGPLFGITAGAGARYQLSEQLAVSLQADVLYNQYLDTLYIFNRVGVLTTANLDLEIK